MLNPGSQGRLPATGLRPQAGFLGPRIVPLSILRAEGAQARLFQVQHDQRGYGGAQGRSTLPEAPLQPVNPLGVETLLVGIGGVAAVIARERALSILTLARQSTLYSGHPGLDVPFWIAYLSSRGVQNLVTDISLNLSTLPVPDRNPVLASGLIPQVVFGHPSQDQLNALFLLAQTASESEAQSIHEQLRREWATRWDRTRVRPHVVIRQRLDAFEAGLEARAIQAFNRAVLSVQTAQLGYQLSQQFFGLLGHRPAIHRGDKADP